MSRRPITLPRISIQSFGSKLSVEEVRNLFDYDPARGVLIWKRSLSPRAAIGRVAGTRHRSGYWRVGIARQYYTLSHLIWLHVKGAWPPSELDHRDLDKDNNRIENLRTATRSQNEANKPTRSKFGCKGVSLDPRTGRWKAKIAFAGKEKHLGYFATMSEASAAHQRAAIASHGEFARD